MPFVNTWDETDPQGTQSVSILDDRIRSLKAALHERIAIEHSFLDGNDANTGRHRLDFGSEASRPAADANVSGAFYWAVDTGKVFMQDSTPAWVQIGSTNIADMADAAGDPLTQYLLVDGSRTLTGDLAVTATKTLDGVDVSLHDHTGVAGHGVQLAAAAFAANAITKAAYATIATFTSANVANVWEDVGVQITFTPTDAANQILILVNGVSGNNRSFDLGIQQNALGEVGITGPFLSSSGSGGTGCGILYLTTFAAAAQEIDLRIRPTTNNSAIVNTISMVVLELKR